MRILILVDCYFPTPKSSAKMAHDLGIELQRRGHTAVVMAPSDGISESLRISKEDGLPIARVRAGSVKSSNKAIRAVAETRLSANLWRRAEGFFRRNRCDLIVFYSPTIFFGPLVRKLKILWRCPAYLILRDIFPEWAVDTKLLRKGLVYQFFHRMEAQQYQTADLIAVQSPGNVEYFARAFPQERFRLKILYNWTALNEPNLPSVSWRTRLGLENKFVFVYGGNIGVAQDMENLVGLAARLAARPDIHFLLVGNGSEVGRLRNSIAGRGLRNMSVLPAVSQSEYLSLVSELDAGVISLDSRLRTHNIPGKLLSYLYWGLPVLASVNPGNDLFDLLKGSRAGFCVLNGDHESFVEAAERLVDDPNLRSEMGWNARRLLERTFSVEVAADQMLEQLREAGLIHATRTALSPIAIKQQCPPTELVRRS